jgi:hypothetical protein
MSVGVAQQRTQSSSDQQFCRTRDWQLCITCLLLMFTLCLLCCRCGCVQLANKPDHWVLPPGGKLPLEADLRKEVCVGVCCLLIGTYTAVKCMQCKVHTVQELEASQVVIGAVIMKQLMTEQGAPINP